jgi:TolB protein
VRRLAPFVIAAVAACSSSSSRKAAPPPCQLDTAGAPWLAFASSRTGSYGIFIARADGTCVEQVTSGPGTDLFPSFGPGWRIAFASDRSGLTSVWVHDLGTSHEWVVPVGTLAATSPAFSTDGARIAFEGRLPSSLDTNIYVVPAAGGDPVQLTTSAAADAGPAWSPDGSTIYFVSTRSGVYDVYAVPAGGGDATRVTTGSGIVGKPAVSPDGHDLYYTRSASSGGTEVVRYALAGGAIAVVTSQSDSEPAVSPAGDRLAVRSFRDGQADLFVVGSGDGGSPVQITNDPASDGAPSFAPAR